MLYIVATPIGNLEDISLRALKILESVALIACEDTRHTKILLDRYGINTATTSYFQHNQLSKTQYLLKLLRDGKDIALVSDAGMPGILDPGYQIINLAIKDNLPITAIPGATALINALVLSGKPAHKFVFEGFLPQRPLARKNRLKKIAQLDYTIIFYESPHRILATLGDIADIWGNRQIVCARELTKKFEEVRRASAKEILESYKKQKIRGEFVVVI